MDAGRLQHWVTFRARAIQNDGYGNRVGAWEGRFSCWAALQYLRGSETVQQARIEGRSPVIVTVRRDSDTDAITTGWSFVLDGRAFDVQEPPVLRDNRDWLEFRAEGKAVVG